MTIPTYLGRVRRPIFIAASVVLTLGAVVRAEPTGAPHRVDLRFDGRIEGIVTPARNQLAVLVVVDLSPVEVPRESTGVNPASPPEGKAPGEDAETEEGEEVVIRIEVGEGGTQAQNAETPEADQESEVEVWWVDVAPSPVEPRRLYAGRQVTPRLGVGDLDGDGRDDLYLAGRGELLDFGSSPGDGRIRRLELPGLSPGTVSLLTPGSRTSRSTRPVALAGVTPGRLVVWNPRRLTDPPHEIALPLEVERQSWGLRLSSPPVALASLSASDSAPDSAPEARDEAKEELESRRAVLVGPRAHGGQRLQSTLTEPGEDPYDSWSRLEVGEDVQSSRYVEIDGRPYLLALTSPAGSVLGKLSLSIFSLERDRSRSGMPAVFRRPIDTHFWFTPQIAFRDENGDGRQDLLLSFREGLGGGDLVVLRARGLGGGRFSPVLDRRKQEFHADDWSFREDVTGDGLADLVFLGEDLEVYRGRTGRKALEKNPIRLAVPEQAPLPEGLDREGSRQLGPALDLDRDGVAEILVESRGGDGTGLSWVRSSETP